MMRRSPTPERCPVFDPERLLRQVMSEAMGGGLGGTRRRKGSRSAGGLGSLLGGALGGNGKSGGLSTATKAKLGLGALGIAIAAYEHYTAKSGPAASGTGASTPPPAPPPASHTPPPPPPPAKSLMQPEEAMHLLRAMVCAAHADGLIDAGERQRILDSARQAGLDADDLAALEGELAAPLTPAQVVARTRPAQRAQVYVAALIATGRDTPEEQHFLDDLAQRLGLGDDERQRLHDELGL